MNEQLIEPVRRVIELLADRKYTEIESLTHRVRLSAMEMERAVSDYGRTLIAPPDQAFTLMNVIEVRNSKPRRWAITMPLWTKEEGRSDLSIELTVIEKGDAFEIELDDIHVL